MKRLLLILILTFSFQSLSKADDIRDFEIEGMSIGDSLLDNFDKKDLNGFIKDGYFYKDNKFVDLFIRPKSSNSKYDYLQITISPSDKKYIIKGLGGQIGYENDIQNCYKKKNTMVSDINKVISKSTRTKTTDKVKHTYDKTGNSYVSSHFYFLKNGNIAIQCYDWSKKLEEKYADKLIVSFKSQVFEDFIVNEAYN